MENENPRQPKEKRLTLPMVLLALCFFVSAAAGALLASSGLFDLDLKKDPIKPVDRMNLETDLIKAKDKTTILIMGVDMRKDDTGRSDTMMIATIDPKLDTASLLSVPRDTRVRIYGYGYDKINAAWAYGGEPLAERTVENLLGIDIDHYIIINTNSFVKIIDAIGGIDIDVEKRMKYDDPWDDNGGLHINIFPGLQHMDGKKAVTYVRYRDSEGDIGRIKRQQKFMEACMEKVMSPSFIPRIPAVVSEVIDAIDTDMTTRQLLELAGALKSAKDNGLETDMVPGYPLYIEDISYWIPDIEELQYAMAMGLGVNVDSKMKSRVKKIADEYSESIPEHIRTSHRPNDEEPISTPRRNDDDFDEDLDSDKNSRHSNYDDDLDYRSSNYDDDLDYRNSNYDDDLDYRSANYDDDSDYRSSNYDDDLDYRSSNYNDDLDYRSSNYDDDLDYHRSNYDDDLYYRSSNYDDDLDYRSSNYDDDLDYRSSNYDDDYYYDDAPTREDDTSKDR